MNLLTAMRIAKADVWAFSAVELQDALEILRKHDLSELSYIVQFKIASRRVLTLLDLGETGHAICYLKSLTINEKGDMCGSFTKHDRRVRA